MKSAATKWKGKTHKSPRRVSTAQLREEGMEQTTNRHARRRKAKLEKKRGGGLNDQEG